VQQIALLLTIALTGLLLASAVLKIRFFDSFAADFRTWRLVPPAGARRYAGWFMAGETVVALTAASAVALSLQGEQNWVLLGTGLIVAAYAVMPIGQVVIRARTRTASCGCGVLKGQVGPYTIVKAAVFASLALGALVILV
jgi:hypothetical protein